MGEQLCSVLEGSKVTQAVLWISTAKTLRSWEGQRGNKIKEVTQKQKARARGRVARQRAEHAKEGREVRAWRSSRKQDLQAQGGQARGECPQSRTEAKLGQDGGLRSKRMVGPRASGVQSGFPASLEYTVRFLS